MMEDDTPKEVTIHIGCELLFKWGFWLGAGLTMGMTVFMMLCIFIAHCVHIL